LLFLSFSLLLPLLPLFTLFPYTTLFRSFVEHVLVRVVARADFVGGIDVCIRGAVAAVADRVAEVEHVIGGEAGVGIRHQRYLEPDRKSTRLNSSHSQISYAVFCLKKKTI